MNNSMCVLTCGRLTPDQLVTAKEKSRGNYQYYFQLHYWIYMNNVHYSNDNIPNQISEPFIYEGTED